MNFGERHTQINIPVFIFIKSRAQVYFVRMGQYLTTVGQHRLVTARTGLRHLHYLVGHILIAVSVIETQAVVEEHEIHTHLDILGVLRLEVFIISQEVWHISSQAVKRICQWITHVHATTINWCVIEIIHVASCLAHLGK